MMTPNHIDVAPATFGVQLVGGVVCPLNFLYTVEELVSQLTSSKAKGLLTNTACLDVACKAASKVGLPLDRILLVGDDKTTTNGVRHFSALDGLSKSVQRVKIDPKEDLAYLVYSSGTTGVPKGVMLTHENIVANITQGTTAGHSQDWKTDKSVGFLPMYHIYGRSDVLSVRRSLTYVYRHRCPLADTHLLWCDSIRHARF